MQKLPIILITKSEIFFPSIRKRLIIEKSMSKASVDYALSGNKKVVFLFEKHKVSDKEADFYKYAVVGEIIQTKIEKAGGKESYKVDFYIKERVLVPHISALKNENIFVLDDYVPYIESLKDINSENILKLGGYVKGLIEDLSIYYDKMQFNDEYLTTELISTVEEVEKYSYEIISGLSISNDEKYNYLKELNLERRLIRLLEYLKERFSFFDALKNIDTRIEKKNFDEEKILYLKDKINSYQKELESLQGFKDSQNPVDYTEMLDKITLKKDEKRYLETEINKFKKQSISEQEKERQEDYLNTIFSLPFNERTEVNTNLKKAKSILDVHHYGMFKVKERIIENLAFYNLSKNKRSSVICLYGPPGVGKTSLGKSIAEATNRKMVRVALGGVKDESEIRGHRRTYVGSKMGRIMDAIKNSGVKNPLILLDEIDKIGEGQEGNNSVASALLEVLDFNQNNSFRDNYLEIGFDLSEVMFVATSNSLNMPSALLDRMDIVSLTGYTEREKLNIIHRYTLPKIISELTIESVLISDSAILKMINDYTLESGVRNLERVVSNFIGKIIKNAMMQEENVSKILSQKTFDEKDVVELLGNPTNIKKVLHQEPKIGVVNGLACSSYGGSVLKIEAVKTDGVGKMALTGQLGSVMKESAQAALTIIKSQHSELQKVIKKSDIHIHLPEGAIPKDGPSAGMALTIAMISSLSEKPVKNDIAMTGEINLSGDVLPVGGVKEKVLAAIRAGVNTVLIPKDNESDLEEIKDEISDKIVVVLIEKVNEAVKIALKQ